MVKEVKLRIAELMRLQGITDADLVERTGIDRTLIWKYKTGRVWLPRERWSVIAGALGVRNAELFADEPLTSIPSEDPAIPDLAA